MSAFSKKEQIKATWSWCTASRAYHRVVCGVLTMNLLTVVLHKNHAAIELLNFLWNVYCYCNFFYCCCCCSGHHDSCVPGPSLGTLLTTNILSPYGKDKEHELVVGTKVNVMQLHFIFSPLVGLLPLRGFVTFIVIILLPAPFADHLLPVADLSLLLGRSS